MVRFEFFTYSLLSAPCVNVHYLCNYLHVSMLLYIQLHIHIHICTQDYNPQMHMFVHLRTLEQFSCICQCVQVCMKTLLELTHRSGQHVLLVGASGAGKTTIINNFLAGRGLSYLRMF